MGGKGACKTVVTRADVGSGKVRVEVAGAVAPAEPEEPVYGSLPLAGLPECG